MHCRRVVWLWLRVDCLRIVCKIWVPKWLSCSVQVQSVGNWKYSLDLPAHRNSQLQWQDVSIPQQRARLFLTYFKLAILFILRNWDPIGKSCRETMINGIVGEMTLYTMVLFKRTNVWFKLWRNYECNLHSTCTTSSRVSWLDVWLCNFRYEWMKLLTVEITQEKSQGKF